MEILNIGIDLTESKDFTDKIHNIKFIDRILSNIEQGIYNDIKSDKRKLEYLSSRFAAKEAFSKALSVYDGNTNFKDIEITNDINGKPLISFIKDKTIKSMLSISHTDNYSIAQVIIYK